MRQILYLLLLLTTISCKSQKTEKIIVSKTDDNELYINDGDSTILYYYKIIPKSNILGTLVILPSGGESTENTLRQLTLQNKAVENNILVIIPSINWGTVDRIAEFNMLDKIFEEVVIQHNVSRKNFILGGLSNGAIISLKYAEKSIENPANFYLIPKGIFAIDAPLDEARFYKYCERELERNIYQPAVNEARWIKNNYDSLYGGPPELFKEMYVKNSIYSYGAKDGGNAKYLKNMPLLMFTDLDSDWLINERHRDLYDWNGIDIVSMVNQLKLIGNQNANVIVSQGKGIRLDGSRNPHSWSILQTDTCIKWMLNLMEE